MDARNAAPILSRVRLWHLIGLGISGWVTLYSAAVITWGASSFTVGNAQGGCFAITMTLAGLESRRFKPTNPIPSDSLHWIKGATTEQLNENITHLIRQEEFQVEAIQPVEAEMGFGVRAVNSGRTLVFETGRWREPFVDLPHVESTEANRKKVRADLAIIVTAGILKEGESLDEFLLNHPVQFVMGEEFKNLIHARQSTEKKAANIG